MGFHEFGESIFYFGLNQHDFLEIITVDEFQMNPQKNDTFIRCFYCASPMPRQPVSLLTYFN